jgi:hypothetical protein
MAWESKDSIWRIRGSVASIGRKTRGLALHARHPTRGMWNVLDPVGMRQTAAITCPPDSAVPSNLLI